MQKRGKSLIILISLILVVLLIASFFLYLSLSGKNYDEKYQNKENSGEIKNPLLNLTDQEAIEKFDEDFVYYFMFNIKAYNLHNPPLSSNTPKIEFQIDELIFNTEILNGEIIVNKGPIEKKDIIIRTSKDQAVKMIRNKGYIEESFSSGASTINLIGAKSILFQKGYLKLYTELTGKTITGNIIRIYIR